MNACSRHIFVCFPHSIPQVGFIQTSPQPPYAQMPPQSVHHYHNNGSKCNLPYPHWRWSSAAWRRTRTAGSRDTRERETFINIVILAKLLLLSLGGETWKRCFCPTSPLFFSFFSFPSFFSFLFSLPLFIWSSKKTDNGIGRVPYSLVMMMVIAHTQGSRLPSGERFEPSALSTTYVTYITYIA